MGKKLYRTDIGIKRQRQRLFYILTTGSIGAVLVISIILWILLYLPSFRVRTTVIEGEGYISEEDVASFLQTAVPGEGFWANLLGYRNMLTWPDSFNSEELKLLPDARSLTVYKSFRDHEVRVEVVPRVRQGIVCFRGGEPPRCAWFDEEGTTLSRAPETEGPLLLFVNDYSRTGGEGVVEERFLANLFSIFEALQKIPLPPREVRIDDHELQEVRVRTFLGPDMYFSLRFPATEAPAAYEALRNKAAVSTLEYIDFRTEDRIYYK